MKDVFISTILQCAIFIGIPGVSYLLFCRKKEGFGHWVGLYKPNNLAWIKPTIVVFIATILLMVSPLLLFMQQGSITKEMLTNMNLASGGLTLEIVGIVLLKAVFQTALSEEILFRGFIGKRLQKKFGFVVGNSIQAILFGLPHGVPFMLVYHQYVVGVTLIICASVVGGLEFYLNEKKAGGSILICSLLGRQVK